MQQINEQILMAADESLTIVYAARPTCVLCENQSCKWTFASPPRPDNKSIEGWRMCYRLILMNLVRRI